MIACPTRTQDAKSAAEQLDRADDMQALAALRNMTANMVSTCPSCLLMSCLIDGLGDGAHAV